MFLVVSVLFKECYWEFTCKSPPVRCSRFHCGLYQLKMQHLKTANIWGQSPTRDAVLLCLSLHQQRNRLLEHSLLKCLWFKLPAYFFSSWAQIVLLRFVYWKAIFQERGSNSRNPLCKFCYSADRCFHIILAYFLIYSHNSHISRWTSARERGDRTEASLPAYMIRMRCNKENGEKVLDFWVPYPVCSHIPS